MYLNRHPPAPTARDVVPGASVNIVLKGDQPTGRTVRGVISQVLTRGDHPRGIKVRLVDGRVGRVKSLTFPSTIHAPLDSRPESRAVPTGHGGQRQDQGDATGGRPMGERRRRRGGGTDIRAGEEEHQALPAQSIGLDMYVKERKKPRSQRRMEADGSSSSATAAGNVRAGRDPAAADLRAPSETVKCPVCSDFEGGDVSVAQHVASHFDETAT